MLTCLFSLSFFKKKEWSHLYVGGVCTRIHKPRGTHTVMHALEPEDNFPDLVLSFHYVDSRNLTQVVRHIGKCPYLLSPYLLSCFLSL